MALFLIPAIVILSYGIMDEGGLKKDESPLDYVRRMTKETFSLSEEVSDIAPKLLYTLYPSQRDGIFITENYLLEDLKPGDFAIENSRTIKAFREETDIPTYFAIVPTAIAVKQEELPQRAVIFNQKKLIDECYKASYPQAKGVDAYSELFAVRDQYLYYKTEPLNTSLGGYYIYHAILKCMRENPLEIDEFSVFHRDRKLLGSLAERVNLRGIEGDLASIYEHESKKNYSVTHIEGDDIKKYYGLYSKGFYDDGFVTLMGGESPVIEIESRGGRFGNLLLVGDKNALSVLPFLACDFDKITYVNPKEASLGYMMDLDTTDFDRAVFCFTTKSITEDISLGKMLKVDA